MASLRRRPYLPARLQFTGGIANVQKATGN
jgi:hypothetical protein